MTDTTLAAAAPRAGRLPLLRAALVADAAVTGANGAAYLIAAGPLGDLLGLDAGLLRGVGAFLLVFAAVVALAARATHPPRRLVRLIVVANAIWAADSLVVAVAGWGSPATAGTVWIVLQALVVAGFAAAQAAGLRRAGRTG